MLSQTKHLIQTTQGRYATDAELEFLQDYANSFALRLRTYQKIRQVEKTLLQSTYQQLRRQHPTLLGQDKQLIRLWQRDTLYVLRFSALILLLDDLDSLRDRLLLWFQTIMRAFGMQKFCYLTYEAMQQVAPTLLEPEEVRLFTQVMGVNQTTFDLPETEATVGS